MILGMTIQTFTFLHVVLSLIGITTGLIVVFGMLTGNRMDGATGVFLISTVLTSVTGFFFPAPAILPSHVVGAVSLVILLPTLVALYGFGLAGVWRWIYISGAMLALYLNVLVGVVQAFQKVAVLQPLAPTQSELPFLVAQAVVLIVFAALGFIAVLRFRPDPLEA